MKGDTQAVQRNPVRHALLAAVAFLTAFRMPAAAQDVAIQLDPQRTNINFTLGDVLHTVRGAFHLKQGLLLLDPTSDKLAGQVVIDAKSGESGNGMRDRKMHREVLESDRYPEIAFRSDRFEGTVSLTGKSSIRVHGVFAIHGTDHEMTVPAQVEMSADRWTATFHFTVPYANWGMRNPSTLFLRVSESVDIDVTAGGTLIRPCSNFRPVSNQSRSWGWIPLLSMHS
ncbi:MAG: YceI family protein [Candidatus Sulfotelmatobacter sp.]